MSKGLEALNILRTTAKAYYEDGCKFWYEDNSEGMYLDDKQAIDIIEKELKALEIIKKKDVHKTMLSLTQSADEYNHFIDDVSEEMQLTQEEYDLLKEVLKNE